MEKFSIQLDGNVSLEIDYEIIGGEPGTYDTPPIPSDYSIQRIWIVSGSNVIDITEVDPSFVEVNMNKIDWELEQHLLNG